MFRLPVAFALASAPWGAVCHEDHDAHEILIDGIQYGHQWTSKAKMPVKRSDMTATTVGDAVFLIGGCEQDQVWVAAGDYPSYMCGGGGVSAVTSYASKYLPRSDTYVTLSPAPRARYRHAAAVVEGKIYLFGGSDATGNIVPEVDVLDTATATWSTLSFVMPSATTDLAAFAFNGKVFVLGGYTASWTAQVKTQIFNPSASGAAAWTSGPDMKEGRGDFAAVVVGTAAYALGGFTDTNGFKLPLASMEMLSLTAEVPSWVSHKDMHVARGDKAVATLHGLVHVIGGESKNAQEHSVPLGDVEVYHGGHNAWYNGGNIPTDRFRFTAAACGDSIYVFGGQGYLVGDYGKESSYYPVLDRVEAYDEKIEVVEKKAVETAAARSAATLAGAVLLLLTAVRL